MRCTYFRKFTYSYFCDDTVKIENNIRFDSMIFHLKKKYNLDIFDLE